MALKQQKRLAGRFPNLKDDWSLPKGSDNAVVFSQEMFLFTGMFFLGFHFRIPVRTTPHLAAAAAADPPLYRSIPQHDESYGNGAKSGE